MNTISRMPHWDPQKAAIVADPAVAISGATKDEIVECGAADGLLKI
jgi:hypothetical protein